MPHILLLDNYDSFTYNLEHYLIALGAHVDVVRSDVAELPAVDYDVIILSPGPGLPNDHPGMLNVLKLYAGKVPILGVCLGMQAIAEYLGGELGNKEVVKHGVREEISVLNHDGLFTGLPLHFHVGLYHSWFVLPSPNYTVDATSVQEDVIMAISNREKMLYGVQFHPESIMSEFGKEILGTFLGIKKGDQMIALH